MAIYDLGNLEPFDPSTALTLAQACQRMRGRGGRSLAVQVARRFANLKRGCRIGEMVVFLPVVKLGGDLLTMASWIKVFELARARLGIRDNRPAPRTRAEFERDQMTAIARLKANGVTSGP